MLLRRLSAHIRDQNWFAVGLDLRVVVVGLILGLQIDTWWEGHKEAGFDATYLREIGEDFELNRSSLLEQMNDAEKITRGMIALYEQSTLDAPTLIAHVG